jgi:hypothetical protein
VREKRKPPESPDCQLLWLEGGVDLEQGGEELFARFLASFVEAVGRAAVEHATICSLPIGSALVEAGGLGAARDYSIALRFVSGEEAVYAELLEDD